MAIIKCPECGHQINETATVCPSCGEKIAGNIVKCYYCGEVYFKDDGICPRCYHSLPQDVHETYENPSSEDSSFENNDELLENRPDSSTNLGEDRQETEKVEVDLNPEEETGDEAVADDVNVLLEEDDEHTPEDTNRKDDVDSESINDSDEVEEESYIDTDDENLEKPVHEDEGKAKEDKNKHKYIPVVVSLAIAALIAAVSLYFYNASKLDNETRAYDVAIGSNDVREMQNFLRNFPDATTIHKQVIQEKIDYINKHKDDLSFVLATRNKERIQQFLNDFPDTPKKQTLLSIVDSIDWEDALKSNTKEAYEHYLQTHATGLFAKEAKDKITVKIVAANAEDEAKAKSLFREFFLSVNGKEPTRLQATLSPQLTSFMGTNAPSSGDVVAWMNRQHKDDVSSVIWKLNHDYKITKLEQNNIKESSVDFTAKQTIIFKDGRSSSEHYKVTATVTENNKISSMSMTKYVPKPGEQTTSSSSSGGSSNTTSKPSGTDTNKPASSTSKPANNSTSKPANNSTSKPANSSTSKPANNNTSKPANNSTSKPANNTSKPANNNTSKPANSTSKPATSNTSKPANNSTSKPANNTSKPATGNKKP